MAHTHNQTVPRSALIAAGCLMAFTIAAAAVGRIGGAESLIPTSSPVAVRDLRFVDRTDGGVDVFDAVGKQPSTLVAPGSDAFLRATLRGLAQNRKRQHLTEDVPFRLTSWADGRLTLDDPATGRHVELEAFGRTNAAAFARLLITGDKP